MGRVERVESPGEEGCEEDTRLSSTATSPRRRRDEFTGGRIRRSRFRRRWRKSSSGRGSYAVERKGVAGRPVRVEKEETQRTEKPPLSGDRSIARQEHARTEGK